jgi:hypothetical protein
MTQLQGTVLNKVANSMLRRPRIRVEVIDPNRVDGIGEVVSGQSTEPPLDITHFCESVSISDNVPFENGNDQTVPAASFTFRPSNAKGYRMRRGFIDDGTIVRIWQYDDRVDQAQAACIFTGHFRGAPGVDPGSRADRSSGWTANAYGREEQFVNLTIDATDSFPAGTDLGEIFFHIATKKMELGQDEILVGALGFRTQHETNQIADIPALQALWECTFPAGKKPKFDGLGRLVAVDFDLDKPAARIFSAGNHAIKSLRMAPNEVEVNNSVLLVGLDHNLTKVVQEAQMLEELEITIGFFEASYSQRYFFSKDRSQRAQETKLRTVKRIIFSGAEYRQVDEFSGQVSIDTHYLAAVRETIFGVYLALQLAIAAIDLAIQSGGTSVANAPVTGEGGTLAVLRTILQITSQVALAFLLWAMQFIGFGRYQIWGKPFEYCYQELKSRCQLNLPQKKIREVTIRNDFLSTMTDLDRVARARLRRELVKNQVAEIELLDDPALGVDQVFETMNGARYYITSVQREYRRGAPAIMRVTAWKVYEDFLAPARRAFQAPETDTILGYGFDFGEHYGEGI